VHTLWLPDVHRVRGQEHRRLALSALPVSEDCEEELMYRIYTINYRPTFIALCMLALVILRACLEETIRMQY